MKSRSINKGTRGRGRVAKACAQCRFAKTRCDIAYGASICTRCAERGIDCEPLEPNAKLRKGDLPKKPAVFVKHSTDKQEVRSIHAMGCGFSGDRTSQHYSGFPISDSSAMKAANARQYYYLPPEDDYQSAFLAKQTSIERSWDREAAERIQRDQFAGRKSDPQQQLLMVDDNMMASNFEVLLSAVESHTSASPNSNVSPLLTPPEPQSFFYNPVLGHNSNVGEGYSCSKKNPANSKNKLGFSNGDGFNYNPTEPGSNSSRTSTQESSLLSIESQGRKDSQSTDFSMIPSSRKLLMTPNGVSGGYCLQKTTNKACADNPSYPSDNNSAFDTAFSPYQSLYDTSQSECALTSRDESNLNYDNKPSFFVGDENPYRQGTTIRAMKPPKFGLSESKVALKPKGMVESEPETQNSLESHQGNNLTGNSSISFTQNILHAIYKQLLERIRLSPSQITPQYTFPSDLNLITAEIVSREGAIKLFEMFKSSYDDWIGLPEGDIETVLDHILNQCPLLATTCCTVALRFGSDQLWKSVYPKLVQFLSLELTETLKNPPMNTECVQALTILAKYADSLCYNDYVFDMWRISASGIRHIEAISDRIGVLTYTYLRLWNQNVLAHICSANITGREIIISKAGVEICAKILEAPCLLPNDNVTVAEVNIMWHTNRYLSHEIPFLDYEKEVQLWRNQWGELKHLPVIQFIEPMLRFCLLLTQWVHEYRCNPSDQPSSIQNRHSQLYTGGSCKYGGSTTSLMSPRDFGASCSSSSIQNVMLEDSMQCMVTRDLIDELLSLNSVISSLIYRVEPRQFMYLSDNIRQIGFLCGVMALAACKILVSREPMCYQAVKPLEICNDLIKKLALRFKMSSRNQDMASTQTMALLELLETVHWPPPQLTTYPCMAEV